MVKDLDGTSGFRGGHATFEWHARLRYPVRIYIVVFRFYVVVIDNFIGCSIKAEILNPLSATYSNYRIIKAERDEP